MVELRDAADAEPANEAVVLVASCDKYMDLWPPFFELLRRNWPDCPYKIYLGSNLAPSNEPGVTTLAIGTDIDWTRSLRAMLEALSSPYVIVLLEDFFLLSAVDTTRITELVRTLRKLDGAYLRLRPLPPPDYPLARSPSVGEIALGAPYRASMQPAIWRRESLLELLRDGENPWQMEIFGARRSDLFERGFYSTWSPALDLYAGVTMGKWVPYGVALCREHGVTVNLKARPMMTPGENAKRAARRVVNVTLEAIPWRIRERMFRWFRATGLRKPPKGLER